MVEEKLYCIYCHISPNGKRYIGQTCEKNPSQRWRDGSRYNDYFVKAVQKYGWDNFEHEILEDDLSLEEANEREEYWIAYYDTTNRQKGYNILLGGNNHTVPQEVRDRISQALIGHETSEEQWEKFSKTMTEKYANGYVNPLLGTHPSEETLQKLRESHIGQVAWNKGIPCSEETREKNRLAHLGKQPTNLAELQEANRQFRQTEEGRLAASLATKGKKWFNNGEQNVRAFECPEGFVEGRLPLDWYNNGVVNTRASECPDGFVRGRLPYSKKEVA